MSVRSRLFASIAVLGFVCSMVPLSPVHAMPAPVTFPSVGPGDLIRGTSLPAVYFMGDDGFRYVFPNEKTYFTWYTNFDDVKMISDADLARFQIGGNVTYRPGVKMIKIQSDPKVYGVGSNGSLSWVPSESAALALYGSDWQKDIDDVPDGFFENYFLTNETYDANAKASVALDDVMYTITTDKGLTPVTEIVVWADRFEDGASDVGNVTTIHAGETVMFINMENGRHSATADDNSWGTGTMSTAGTFFVRRFSTPGEYPYHCSYDQSVTGTIIVTAPEQQT